MIAESADIKFACSQCGQRIVVDKSAAGMTGTCPICEGPVTVPHASEFEDHDQEEVPAPTKASEKAGREVYTDPGLTQTREELFATSVELGQLQRELDETKHELERQRSLFKKAVDECERVTASATHAQAEIKSFQTDRQQLKQRAVAAETQVAELATALAAANHENVALRQQVDNDLTLSHSRLEATETQLTVRERELEALRDENSQIVQSLAGTQSELAALAAELAGAREELGGTAHALQETTRVHDQLSEAKRDLQTRLDLATAEGQRLRQELAQLGERAEELRRDLTETDAGQELIDLRSRLRDLTDDRAKIADTLAEKRAEVRTLTAIEESLRAELDTAQKERVAAEQKAAANSELQLNKDNEVLRGIVSRQNTTLGVYYSEVRRLRRARLGLRIIYGLFGLTLAALAVFAVVIFTHQGAGDLIAKFLH